MMRKYIDAEDFKEILKVLVEAGFSSNLNAFMFACFASLVMKKIDDFPAADVEEIRHAEWIIKEPLPRTYGRPRSMCSRCGAFARYEHVNVSVYHEDLSRRCPECGARMDGGTK